MRPGSVKALAAGFLMLISMFMRWWGSSLASVSIIELTINPKLLHMLWKTMHSIGFVTWDYPEWVEQLPAIALASLIIGIIATFALAASYRRKPGYVAIPATLTALILFAVAIFAAGGTNAIFSEFMGIYSGLQEGYALTAIAMLLTAWAMGDKYY